MKIRAELIRPFILKTMKLQEIKGFGEKRIAKLASNGIYDPLDLLMIFPEKSSCSSCVNMGIGSVPHQFGKPI